MKNLFSQKQALVFVFLLSFVFCLAKAQDLIVIENLKFPLSWKLKKVITVPKTRLLNFSNRFGAPLQELKNFHFDASGIPLQINLLQFVTESGAKKGYQTLVSLIKTKERCQIVRNQVFEYISPNKFVLQKAKALVAPQLLKVVRWKAKLAVAPINKAEYMKWNMFFNLLHAYQKKPEENKINLQRYKTYFLFYKKVLLRTPDCSFGTPEYNFSAPVFMQQSNNDITQFTFKTIKQIERIPYLEIEAKIPVFPFTAYKTKNKISLENLTQENYFWPVKHATIQKVLQSLITPEQTPQEKVEVLLNWVYKEIQYSGKIVGSRYGVDQVLKQGYGHCWDKSDVFITLCRAAGIPARQVGGWLFSVSGHIWAEVYLEEKGWLGVDPTCSWLGTSGDYVPFFISEDGKFPVVYWGIPELEVMKAK